VQRWLTLSRMALGSRLLSILVLIAESLCAALRKRTKTSSFGVVLGSPMGVGLQQKTSLVSQSLNKRL
jgi:hypothetical protein